MDDKPNDDDLLYEIFEASPIGIALEDFEGRPLFANRALCALLGFSEQEMRAKHCVEFSPPEDAKKDQALFEQMKGGSTKRYQLNKRFIRRDNSLLWGRLTVSTLKDRPLVIASVEDITDQRAAQDLLRILASLDLVTSQMAAGVVRCSRDFRYIWANDRYAKWLRRSPDQITGFSIADVAGQEAFDALRPYFERVLAGEKVTFEKEVNLKGIGPTWVASTLTPTIDGWVAVEMDVTERKRAEEAISTVSQKLIAAQEEERKWIARELHDDVNQRLALLAVMLERIGQQLPDEIAELRQDIQNASRTASELGEDVQALSHRLHSSKLEYLGLAGAARSFCSEISARHKAEILFQSNNIPRDLPDEISLSLFRVLQEGLQNGVKHSGASRFEVSLTAGRSAIELVVTDGGHGFNIDEAMAGNGIGITGMKERLKLVGGTLSIESQPQHGTRVYARVPVPEGG